MGTLVSAIIPVYNGALFVADAIDSVRRQAGVATEIVVVDDGSTDETRAVLERLGDVVRFIRQPHAGPAVARNTGLAAARGELIAFLDADDLWPDGRLSALAQHLARDPGLEVVLGRCQNIVSADGVAGSYEPLSHPIDVLSLGAGVFRRSVFQRIGPLDPALRAAEDWDWFLRALEAGTRMLMTETVALLVRRHAHNTTRDSALCHASVLRALKSSLDRRRSHGSGIPAPVPAIPGFNAPADDMRRALEALRSADHRFGLRDRPTP